MYVLLDKEEIPVKIIVKPNKNLYIRVNDSLELEVTCNKKVSLEEIKKIIYKNEKSLIKMIKRKKEEVLHKTEFYYLGKSYVLIYLESIKSPKIEEEFIYFKDEKMKDKFYFNEEKRVFQSRLDLWTPYFSYAPKYSLKIRKMKTRWGVCNRGNNTITLNSELIKKDISLIDYVVIHELSHFKEANHSDQFWHEVELRCPDYKERRKMLNEP